MCVSKSVYVLAPDFLFSVSNGFVHEPVHILPHTSLILSILVLSCDFSIYWLLFHGSMVESSGGCLSVGS